MFVVLVLVGYHNRRVPDPQSDSKSRQAVEKRPRGALTSPHPISRPPASLRPLVADLLPLLGNLPQLLDDLLQTSAPPDTETQLGRGRLTQSASGFTPFSIIEMQIESVRRSMWQFYSRQHASLPPHTMKEVQGQSPGGIRDSGEGRGERANAPGWWKSRGVCRRPAARRRACRRVSRRPFSLHSARAALWFFGLEVGGDVDVDVEVGFNSLVLVGLTRLVVALGRRAALQ